jgi:hypothetical protein
VLCFLADHPFWRKSRLSGATCRSIRVSPFNHLCFGNIVSRGQSPFLALLFVDAYASHRRRIVRKREAGNGRDRLTPVKKLRIDIPQPSSGLDFFTGISMFCSFLDRLISPRSNQIPSEAVRPIRDHSRSSSATVRRPAKNSATTLFVGISLFL